MATPLLQAIRHQLIKRLGRPLAKRVEGFYVSGKVDQREFVGLLDRPKAETIALLKRAGFRPNYLSAYKTIRGTDTTEHSSWAWRGTIGDPTDVSTFQYDDRADYQLHVHLFEIDGEAGTTAIFAHWEPNWKVHPLKHYRATPNDEKGVTAAITLLKDHLSNDSALRTDVSFAAVHRPRKQRSRSQKATGALADVSAVSLLVTAMQTYASSPNTAIGMALVAGLVFLAKQYHVSLGVEPDTLVPIAAEGVEAAREATEGNQSQ